MAKTLHQLAPGTGISSKVKVPTTVGLVVAAGVGIAASFGIELPFDEDEILSIVASVMFLYSSAHWAIAWWVKERNPSRSAIDTVLDQPGLLEAALDRALADDPTLSSMVVDRVGVRRVYSTDEVVLDRVGARGPKRAKAIDTDELDADG